MDPLLSVSTSAKKDDELAPPPSVVAPRDQLESNEPIDIQQQSDVTESSEEEILEEPDDTQDEDYNISASDEEVDSSEKSDAEEEEESESECSADSDDSSSNENTDHAVRQSLEHQNDDDDEPILRKTAIKKKTRVVSTTTDDDDTGSNGQRHRTKEKPNQKAPNFRRRKIKTDPSVRVAVGDSNKSRDCLRMPELKRSKNNPKCFVFPCPWDNQLVEFDEHDPNPKMRSIYCDKRCIRKHVNEIVRDYRRLPQSGEKATKSTTTTTGPLTINLIERISHDLLVLPESEVYSFVKNNRTYSVFKPARNFSIDVPGVYSKPGSSRNMDDKFLTAKLSMRSSVKDTTLDSDEDGDDEHQDEDYEGSNSDDDMYSRVKRNNKKLSTTSKSSRNKSRHVRDSSMDSHRSLSPELAQFTSTSTTNTSASSKKKDEAVAAATQRRESSSSATSDKPVTPTAPPFRIPKKKNVQANASITNAKNVKHPECAPPGVGWKSSVHATEEAKERVEARMKNKRSHSFEKATSDKRPPFDRFNSLGNSREGNVSPENRNGASGSAAGGTRTFKRPRLSNSTSSDDNNKQEEAVESGTLIRLRDENRGGNLSENYLKIRNEQLNILLKLLSMRYELKFI